MRHDIGKNVHGTALHGAVKQFAQFLVGLGRGKPVVGGAGILLFGGADKGAVLDAGDVVGIGAVQVAARKQLLVELFHLFTSLELSAVQQNFMIFRG